MDTYSIKLGLINSTAKQYVVQIMFIQVRKVRIPK